TSRFDEVPDSATTPSSGDKVYGQSFVQRSDDDAFPALRFTVGALATSADADPDLIRLRVDRRDPVREDVRLGDQAAPFHVRRRGDARSEVANGTLLALHLLSHRRVVEIHVSADREDPRAVTRDDLATVVAGTSPA